MPVGIEQHIGDLLNADLGTQDYLAISNFFKGITNFNTLSLEQRRVLDSFHLMDSQLSNELITKQATLLNMLHRERVLTDSQLREVQQMGQSFSFMYRDKKYQNGKFDRNFTNDLTDLVQTRKRNLWDHRIDEAYENFREQNYFSDLSTAESRSVKSAFREEFEQHLKTGRDYIGRRYREDMGFEQITDLTHPPVPDELMNLPEVPQHWTGRVPNRNPVLDLTLADSEMHEIAMHTINFEKAMQKDVFDNPFATDYDLMRQFETIPPEVSDVNMEAWLLKTKGRNWNSYKQNFAIWDQARAEMNDLTKVSEGWSSSRHSTVTEDTSHSGQSSLNRDYFRGQQDHLSNLSEDLRSTHTESELLIQSETNSAVHSELLHEEYPFDGIPSIESPVPSSMQSLTREYIESDIEGSIALAADGSVLLNGAGMLKWLGTNITAMGVVVGAQEAMNWLIRNSNMSESSKKWLNIGVSGMVALTGIVLQPESPLGWLAGLAIPVLQAVAWFALPHKKRVMNDNPLEIYGRRWGMVRARDGHGKMCWYLAFSGSKKEWAVAFAANKTIRMNYGKLSDLIFKSERDGTVKPYFAGPKHQKEFEISTRDWNDKHRGLSKMHGTDWLYAGKKYQQKYDPLRDWYLFSDDERLQMYEDLVKGENLKKYEDHVDDRNEMGTYTKSLLNLHDAIAFIEKWKRNYDQDDITVDAFGNHGLRRVTKESGLFDSLYDWEYGGKGKSISRKPRDHLQGAKTQEELFKQFKIEKSHLTENKWILDYFAKQTKDLLRTQRNAADLFGYKKLQAEEGLKDYYWRFYNPSTGYQPARSAQELENQAKEIYKRSIPPAQKKYLAQKVISRYLLQELADRDLGNNVWAYGYGQYPLKTAVGLHVGIVQGIGKYHKSWAKAKDKKKDPDYLGIFGNEQVQINGKWSGLPSPFADLGENNVPKWLGRLGYLGDDVRFIPEYATDRDKLQTQVDALNKMVQTKYKLAIVKRPVKVIPGLQKIKELSPHMQKLLKQDKDKPKPKNFLEQIKAQGVFGSKPKVKTGKGHPLSKIREQPVKKPLVDTSGPGPGRPEQSKGEHPTKFFDRKANEIIEAKTGRKVKHKDFPTVHLPTIHEKPGTIIRSNAGHVIDTAANKSWTVHKHTEREHDELMQYLWEQHGMSTIPNVSWLLKDEEQHVVLKNDRHLHDQLNLPDYIRVVKEGNVLHEQVDPEKYIPRFASDLPLTQKQQPGKVQQFMKHNPGFVSGEAKA